jgi:hypothetical protein
MAILKITAAWSGFTGAPGYSNFYFKDFSVEGGNPVEADADAAGDRVETFFGAVAGLLPAAVKVTVSTEAAVIDEANGDILNFFSTGTRAAVSGTAAANGYSAASGVVVTWRTGGVVAGRRVRGRTFLVPTATVAYDLDGTLQNSSITTLQNAANALISDTGTPDLGVWARPMAAHTNAKGELIPERDGSWHNVLTASIPDRVAVLRSRRG